MRNLNKYHGQRITRSESIRLKCLDCCCDQQSEVKLCPAYGCPLWAYRLGHGWQDPVKAADWELQWPDGTRHKLASASGQSAKSKKGIPVSTEPASGRNDELAKRNDPQKRFVHVVDNVFSRERIESMGIIGAMVQVGDELFDPADVVGPDGAESS